LGTCCLVRKSTELLTGPVEGENKGGDIVSETNLRSHSGGSVKNDLKYSSGERGGKLTDESFRGTAVLVIVRGGQKAKN